MMIETIQDYREEILKFKNELGQERVTLFRGQSNHGTGNTGNRDSAH